MSIRGCFTGKIAAGAVDPDAGARILGTLDEVLRERHGKHAAMLAAAIAKDEARRKADLYYGQTVAQANVLRAFHQYDSAIGRLRETPGDLGFGNKAPPTLGNGQSTLGFALRSLLARDPFEIATWSNVASVARQVRGDAHRVFAEAIEHLRPKGFGFKAETTRELDILRQAYGGATADPNAAAAWKAWGQVNGRLVDDFVDAGGSLRKRDDYFPNPTFDPSKVKALGEGRFKQLVRDNVDRNRVIDFNTDQPMTTGRFERLLNDAWRAIAGFGEGIPTAGGGGQPMLANARTSPRLFQWKDAEAWQRIAETVGTHASPYEAMMGHIEGLANDIAMMRVLGPNPEATKRFALDLLSREAARLQVTAAGASGKELAAATRANRKVETRVKIDRRMFENLYAEVSGENRIPVNTALAQGAADVRHWLSATQLGSALISSFTDPVSMAMISRFNGLPVMNVLGRATKMMGEKGAEIFAAQQGLVMDTLANVAGSTDKVLGESIRTGVAAKLANANIRLSGLRRWTAILRASFGLEMMAHTARARATAFAELEPRFRETLGRYGIAEADWDLIRNTVPHEPRPNATFTRSVEIAEGGTAAHRLAAEKYARLINTEMDYAVIEGDPFTRALLLGESQPGTIGGETRRSVMMYRSFPATFVTMHFARALARGWDGRRLSHAALTFTAMTAFGALAMQSKEIAAGRDPLTLNPTESNGLRAWGKAMLQGGGLGVFGDVLFVDQTKYGNTWAAMVAGPVAGSVESILGDFVIKNIQQAGKGKETHLLGDALYALGRHTPGSSLWFGRLAFQREVLDQLALMADPRTRERFARMEDTARKEWGQTYWWQPGRTSPRRAPELGAIGGRE